MLQELTLLNAKCAHIVDFRLTINIFVTYRLNFFPSDPMVKLLLCTIQMQLDYNRNHYANSKLVPAFQWHLN